MPIVGGSVKFIVPSNYNEGRNGIEVTLHFSTDEDPDIAVRAVNQARHLAIQGQRGDLSMAKQPVQETQEPKGKATRSRAAESVAQPAPVATPEAATSAASVTDEDETPSEKPSQQPAAPEPISDTTLTAAVHKAKARGALGPDIRKLVTSFAPRVTEIAQERRQEFLDQIGML